MPTPMTHPEICKPPNLVSRMLRWLNFANPEDVMYRIARDNVHYMNYGLSKKDDPRPDTIDRAEENNYLELLSLAGLMPPADTLNFLEIGCGFGYGSQLINSVFRPKGILAIDLVPNAIRYANSKWNNPNVVYRNQRFSRDTAEANNIDLIYTVESGGYFPDQEAFHASFGMLKKGGVFLVASINPIEELRRKKEYALAAGFELAGERDVTAEVLSYLHSEAKSRKFYSLLDKVPFMQRLLCRLFMRRLKDLTRMPGSMAIKRLGTSEFYYHFCFRKA